LRNATNPDARYASWGKAQPYAADFSQLRNQVAAVPRQPTQHTFGLRNDPAPAAGHYDWLVHLDRPLINPMELLHVAGCQPHQLTHRFVTGDGPFGHRAPWFDQARRIYRVLEFLETKDRAAGIAAGGRIPGKINLNTVWDPETFRALCDPQPPNHFTKADVDAIYQRLLLLRTPARAPGPNDRPFLSLATGFTAPNDPQYPAGAGIEDTLLRSYLDPNDPARRLFQVPFTSVPGHTNVPGEEHPYVRDELLTKLFNNVTTRSNVFAVWVTVGFFEVTDATARPVKLGPEIGWSEGRPVRHRMFAIVDRSTLLSNPGPEARFDPRADVGLVPYFSIID
jgi:hypothetical protein